MADTKFHDPGEPVKCSVKECKARFSRPQDAMGALSTPDIAQLHGWRQARIAVAGVEGETDALLCPQHTHVLEGDVSRTSIHERERHVHEDPELAESIRKGVEAAERGDTRDLGDFSQYLNLKEEDEDA